MPETAREAAHMAAERIAADICGADLGDGELGASFGIATGSDQDEAALPEAADRELLEAKDRLYGRASAEAGSERTTGLEPATSSLGSLRSTN